jgi:GNAT superfamily N-acetyltransferase
MQLRYKENPDITAVQVANLREAVGWDRREEQIRRILGRTYFHAGCFHDDSLIGYVDVFSDGVEDAFLRDLMVHPDFQRRGVGLHLVAMARDRVKRDGIKMLNTLFDPRLAGFYRKSGFHIMCGGLIDNDPPVSSEGETELTTQPRRMG